MKPPICHLCGQPVDGAGDLVRFADFVPLPDGMTGHPHGLEWFCVRHVDRARALSGRSIDDAMARMR